MSYKRIALYFLIENDTPYYVGVTSMGSLRYSKEKKKHMEIIEYHDNRVSAQKSETFWIAQLSAWGFKLKNKHKKTSLISSECTKGFILVGIDGEILNLPVTEIRFDITEKQYQKLLEIDDMLKIPPSAIVRLALDCFLPKTKNENFRYAGIKDLWDSQKF